MASSEDEEYVYEERERRKRKCSHCNKTLSSQQNLREHMYIHTGERPYLCNEPGCTQSFRQGSLLSIHKKIHSEVKKSQSESKKTENPGFLKLTKFINSCSELHQTLSKEQIETLKLEIPQEKFQFVKEYLNKH